LHPKRVKIFNSKSAKNILNVSEAAAKALPVVAVHLEWDEMPKGRSMRIEGIKW
jgi:hypothetical protein